MQNAGEIRRRININRSEFCEYLNGVPGTTYGDILNVIILNAAKISRSYYAGFMMRATRHALSVGQ